MSCVFVFAFVKKKIVSIVTTAFGKMEERGFFFLSYEIEDLTNISNFVR